MANDFYDDEPVASKSGTMLSRSILGGKKVKPGDTVTLRILKVYDDELGVEQVNKEGDEEDKGDTGAEPTEVPEEEAKPAEAPATDDMYA